MTREEASFCLANIDRRVCDDELNEALDIAIKALEQEPCEDTISRQIISDYVESHIQEINTGYGDLNKHTNKILRMVVDYIESMPSVTPQPQTVLYSGDGYADGYMVYDMAECPNCGYEYEDGDKDWRLPFCPNCGQSLNWESEG